MSSLFNGYRLDLYNSLMDHLVPAPIRYRFHELDSINIRWLWNPSLIIEFLIIGLSHSSAFYFLSETRRKRRPDLASPLEGIIFSKLSRKFRSNPASSSSISVVKSKTVNSVSKTTLLESARHASLHKSFNAWLPSFKTNFIGCKSRWTIFD